MLIGTIAQFLRTIQYIALANILPQPVIGKYTQIKHTKNPNISILTPEQKKHNQNTIK